MHPALVSEIHFPTKNNEEIIFDAMRFGKDIIVQRSTVSNNLGIEWLRRYANRLGLRVHMVEAKNDSMPFHIDATLMPLRKDFMVMGDGLHSIPSEYLQMFKDNDWDIATPPDPLPAINMGYGQCTDWLAINMFSISPKKVLVESSQTKIIDFLEDRDFDVIPIELYALNDFGGGLHCATLDLRRDGELKDYFPDQTNAPLQDGRWRD